MENSIKTEKSDHLSIAENPNAILPEEVKIVVEEMQKLRSFTSLLAEIDNYLGPNNSHGVNIMMLMADLSVKISEKEREAREKWRNSATVES